MTLRVILQIVPFGDETKTREIGRLDIFNKQQLSLNFCEYGVIQLDPKEQGLFEHTITHHRTDGAWQLVQKAISILRLKGPL